MDSHLARVLDDKPVTPSDIPPAYSTSPADLDYSSSSDRYSAQTFNTHPQPAHLTYPVQPQVQTVSFPLFYFSGWRWNFKVLQTEEADLLPANFLQNTKAELDSIMDSPLARAQKAMIFVIPLTFLATLITIPITFLTYEPFSTGLPLPFYVAPFVFASMIVFIVLQVTLYRRLNSLCESITRQSTEIYGEKILVGLHSGTRWSSGETTYDEVFEFHNKNGRRITSSQYIRVTLRRRVMVPVVLMPINIS